MDMRVAVAAALLMAAMPLSPLAECCVADPSALDRDPARPPLRVMRDTAMAELLVSWESHGSDSRLWQGDLDALWSTSRLEDSPVAETSDPELRLPEPVGSVYFLVSGWCNGLHCTRGRDSFGEDRGTPGCEILERGRIWSDAASCLGVGQGVIREPSEYDPFATCFAPGDPPAPPATGEALVWKTDYANSACGTCLEFSCASLFGGQLIAEPHGGPWGDCDAIHHGGAWARVPAAASIIILEEMPPAPLYDICY